jgi:putative protease
MSKQNMIRNAHDKHGRAELLMPAGSLEKLKVAVLYGADAVYMGTPDMSLRTTSSFTLEEVVEGIEFAHAHGKRVYLTLNLFAHNKDIPKLPEYLDTVRKVKPDGLIVADPGVFAFVKEHAPELEVHISTQANVTSWLTVDYWKKQGASLVVLAREVTYGELCEIREKCPDIKLEAFVHGAMCMTYSGRCMLSNYMAERGANQGNCANSCRWQYKVSLRLNDGTIQDLELTEENMKMFEFLLEEGCRPGELLPIIEDGRGTYILNSKDLCLMPKLDDYLKIGVNSLKVEGRGKSPYYVAVVARAYRQAIDDYYKDPENWRPNEYMRELETVGNRGYTIAFHEGRLKNYAHNYENTRTLAEWKLGGVIREVTEDSFIVEVKNKLSAGDVMEFISPYDREIIRLRLYEYEYADNGKKVETVNAGPQRKIRIPFSAFDLENPSKLKENLPPLSMIRIENALTEEAWNRLKLDYTASKIENGTGVEAMYWKRQKDLQNSIDSDALMERTIKSPRFGIEGCCGKGCNGCLMFWHDPSYEKARKLLAQKKQGEMFDKDMIEEDPLKEAV